MNLFNKIINDIKINGVIRTIKKIVLTLAFHFRLKTVYGLLKIKKLLKGREIAVKHGSKKFYFFNHGDKNEILYHSFWKKFYTEEKNQIKDIIKKDDIVLDVGGNLGFFALILSDLVGGNGKVYTAEPSKYSYGRLEKNLAINHLTNVESLNFGFGEREGTELLYYNPGQTGLSSIVHKPTENSIKEEIKITTIDKFRENVGRRISFIKIDTEGFEPQVLLGAQKVLREDKPVIFIELGSKYLESSEKSIEILKRFNYKSAAFEIDLSKVPAGKNFIAQVSN